MSEQLELADADAPEPMHLRRGGEAVLLHQAVPGHARDLQVGRRLADVVTLPRSALHDGNTVWLVTSENTLSIREVTPVWRDEDSIVVQEGLTQGDRLITSALPAPIDGMPLRMDAGQSPGTTPDTESGKKGDAS